MNTLTNTSGNIFIVTDEIYQAVKDCKKDHTTNFVMVYDTDGNPHMYAIDHTSN